MVAPQGWRSIHGRRIARLLALLVIGEGGGSTTDDLVDGVWPSERPRTARQSLVNVVSGLRRDFGNDLIETTPVGYRLGSSVGSDRNDFFAEVRVAEHCLRHDPERSDEVVRSALKRWRGEPWMGLDGWQLDQDRYALLATRDRAVRTQAMALVALERHAEAAEILLRIIDSTSADEDLWAALATALAGESRRLDALRVLRRARSALREIGLTPGPQLLELEDALLIDGARRPRASDGHRRRQWNRLADCVRLWSHGHPDEAVIQLRELEQRAVVDSDDARRFARAFRITKPEDGWARGRWREVVGIPEQMVGRAERVLISLDAYALELSPDGLSTAEREIEGASSAADRLRALRVRFMAGLAVPISTRQIELIEELDAAGDDVGRIEAARFRAVLACKRGRFAETLRLLDRYDTLVQNLRPMWMDDFAALSRVVMALGAVMPEATVDDATTTLFPVLSNLSTVDVAEVWASLDIGPDVGGPSALAQLDRVSATLPVDTATAFALAFALRRGEHARTIELAAALAGRSLDGSAGTHRYWQLAPAVLAEAAIVHGDADLAERVAGALEPWGDEQLGLWPLDLLVGSASRLLDRLAPSGR